MMRSQVVRQLLYGAIRRDNGNGLVFYVALKNATPNELRRALVKLDGKWAQLLYPYGALRRNAIKNMLAEKGADDERN